MNIKRNKPPTVAIILLAACVLGALHVGGSLTRQKSPARAVTAPQTMYQEAAVAPERQPDRLPLCKLPLMFPTRLYVADKPSVAVRISRAPLLGPGQWVEWGQEDEGVSNMALPASIIVSGGGTTTVNGTYTLHAGVDTNGNQYYTFGTFITIYLYWMPSVSAWYLGPTLNSFTGTYYRTNVGATLAGGPSSQTWEVSNGTSPAPTVTAGTPPAGRFRRIGMNGGFGGMTGGFPD